MKIGGLKTKDPTGLGSDVNQGLTIANPYLGQLDALGNALKGGDSGSSDKSSIDDISKQMSVLGMNELQQYQDIKNDPTGTKGITPEQQAQIDRQTAVEQAQVRQAMVNAGMTESSTRLSGESRVLEDKVAMQEATRQATEKEHFDAAVKALGIGSQSSSILASMSAADRQQALQIYGDAIGTGALVASSYKSVVSDYTAGEGQSVQYIPGSIIDPFASQGDTP